MITSMISSSGSSVMATTFSSPSLLRQIKLILQLQEHRHVYTLNITPPNTLSPSQLLPHMNLEGQRDHQGVRNPHMIPGYDQIDTCCPCLSCIPTRGGEREREREQEKERESTGESGE